MHIIRHLEDLPQQARGGAVAIGNFDGVHRGHAKIIERLLERAEELHGPAVVFTFDPHPVRILRPDQSPPPLTWTERKAELLASHGADWIVAYPTDQALLNLTAEQFFSHIVCDKLAAKGLVEGANFYFGHNREGNIQRLRTLCQAAGISIDVVEPLIVDGQIVSSSHIRQLLHEGAVDRARELLGVPYRIRGMVIHGAGRGAQIGFPTANLEAIDTMLPAVGVYAGIAWCEGIARPAAINLGPSPTFGDATVKVEVHVIGQSEPLYGQPLEVDFLARLRDIQRFASADALVDQLARDVGEVKRIAQLDLPKS